MNARNLVLGRDEAPRFSAVRLFFGTLGAISPRLTAAIADRIWFRPPRPPVSEAARAFLATGERIDVDVRGRRVVAWSWGSGPAVILMHGWGGFGAQLERFVDPLVREGYRAVLFDALAHGVSGPSPHGPRRTTFFDFADALHVLAERFGPLEGVVAHSGGCIGVAWAIRDGFQVPAAVFIAPMASPIRYQRMFQQALGLSDRVLERFAANVERWLGIRWADMEMEGIPRAAATPPVLVIHDRDDRETSWSEGAAVAETWPRAEMITTTGLGHRRILRDDSVIESTVGFLAAQRESSAPRSILSS